MQIGSKPSEKVYQGKESPDTFLVVDTEEAMLYLYVTVETLLCPRMEAFCARQDEPYFWHEVNGMMSVLVEVSRRGFANLWDQQEAEGILEAMEGELQTV